MNVPERMDPAGRRDPRRPLHVVVLGPYLRFPNGMAGTSRLRLLSRALVESGADVLVLCSQASERPPQVENTALRGEVQGVRFEYMTWTTARHDSLFMRRIIAGWGWVHTAWKLAGLRWSGHADVAYVWPDAAPRWHHLAGQVVLRALSTPGVWELNEKPWSLTPPTIVRRLWSPLAGMAGVVPISGFLTEWVGDEARRLRRFVEIIEVPIVVDVEEQPLSDYPVGDPRTVVFAGSPVYGKTIRFIFTAMQRVWKEVPDCRLVVAGANEGDPRALWLYEEARQEPRICVPGYVDREELLALYRQASALLIPMFENANAIARFPTKLGEYLASGRPVVTSAVGEVPRFLQDGLSAIVCAPGDADAYAEAILALLRDPGTAAAIGREGRRVAEERFDYRLYAEKLYRGFAAVAARGQ